MPTRVQLPDGSIGEFPDGMKDADIEAVLQKQYGGTKTAAPSQPTDTLTASQPDTWLHQAENDFTQGGNRTVVGRTLGTLQGRGDKGYSGIDSGVSKPVANFMGSPELGLLHAGESAQTIPDHPVKGALGTIGGLLESATIPGLAMGGPGAEAAIDTVPSAKYAGKLFESLEGSLANHPVSLNNSSAPLNDMLTLGKQGGGTVPVPARQLAGRIGQGTSRSVPILRQMQNDLGGITEAASTPKPVLYPEARNFQKGLSSLSRLDSDALGGPMKGGLKQLNSALYGDIYDSLLPTGHAENYAQAMKEFRQASQLKDLVTRGAKYAGHAALGATAAGGLYEAYKALK